MVGVDYTTTRCDINADSSFTSPYQLSCAVLKKETVQFSSTVAYKKEVSEHFFKLKWKTRPVH